VAAYVYDWLHISTILQRIRSTVDEKEQKQLLMDLDVVMRSNDCPYIVKFYGALFKEVSNLMKLLYFVVLCSLSGCLFMSKHSNV
jgi:hypothetical protein